MSLNKSMTRLAETKKTVASFDTLCSAVNMESKIFTTDKWSKLDWRIFVEGRFHLEEAMDKFEQPDVIGWRLPTIDELKTLKNNRQVTDSFKPHAYDTSALWSCTRHTTSLKSAWTFSLDGRLTYHFGEYFLPVRLVRNNLS